MTVSTWIETKRLYIRIVAFVIIIMVHQIVKN